MPERISQVVLYQARLNRPLKKSQLRAVRVVRAFRPALMDVYEGFSPEVPSF